jgi:hypothetical protein
MSLPLQIRKAESRLEVSALEPFRFTEVLAFMAWAKSKAFLEKLQLCSIVLYLICLGGYAIPPVRDLFEEFQKAAQFKVVEILGFTFFSLFIASTVLLRLEEGEPDSTASSTSEASLP